MQQQIVTRFVPLAGLDNGQFYYSFNLTKKKTLKKKGGKHKSKMKVSERSVWWVWKWNICYGLSGKCCCL